MNVHREPLFADFPLMEAAKTQELGKSLIIEPGAGVNAQQFHSLEVVIEEAMGKACEVVIHMQDSVGENPANYYTKRVKIEAGRTKRVKFPVLPALAWVELFSRTGNFILRELNGLRILPPFDEHQIASPTSATVVVPRGKVRFTPSGFEVDSNFLDSEAPVFATMLRPLDGDTVYQLHCTADAMCQFQNTDGLKDDFFGYWNQIFFQADFSPPVFVFWMNSRAERSGLLRCNTKLLATYEKPEVDMTRPTIWNVKTA